jgi:SAM-dependent methyltransferase
MMPLQQRAEAMIARHGFVGVPPDTYAEGGRNQFIALLEAGLSPEASVLDIGCGTLRAGYWLIRFLGRDRYCGIEPARERVTLGLRYIVPRNERWRKHPRFDFNAGFDTSVFRTTFDFFLAGSIWTHASKRQIERTLDGFVRDTTHAASFLTTYLPARRAEEDYRGTSWVGTGPQSSTPGVVRHSLEWIAEQCTSRGLTVEERPLPAFDSQFWLRIRRA